MKKFWLLLLCLTMALMTGVAMADEVPAELLGEWDIVSLGGDEETAQAVELIKSLGGTMTIEITESELIMRATIFGETTEDATPISVEGNTINLGGEAVPYTLDGDTLTIDDGVMSMVLQRVGTVAETETAETAEVLWEEGSILGPWNVVEFFGDEDAAQSMELIKSMGGSVTVTFTETEMILAMSIFGETMEEVTEYVIEGDTIVAVDGEPVHFVLDGTTLTIGGEDEAGMLLQRPDAPVETVEVTETADDGSIFGKWVLVDTVGDGPTGQYFDMGATVEVEFVENEMILTVSIWGYTESVNMPCEIEADQIVFEGVPEKYEIEGNTLTLYEATETLIFERK